MKDFPEWPRYSEEEISAVGAVLRSGKVNYWTGEQGKLFEAEYASYVGVPYAIALANGTVALELALHAFGIGHGDEVIVPCRTFIATASSVVMRGGQPVFVDIDPETQNIDPEKIEAAITPKTKAIIVVHLGGWPCEMEQIAEIARCHNLRLIEDCAQAHGAAYNGKPVGSFGDAAAFSFCQDKIMTTGGEGGMLLLKEEAAWRRAWAYKDHGKDYNLVHRHDHPPGHRWLHSSFGTNWRMTEMQAAIGRIQLRNLDETQARRQQNADYLSGKLRKVHGLYVPGLPSHIRHAWYRLYVVLRQECLCEVWDQNRIVEAILAEGVPVFHGSCSEIYRERAFETIGWPDGLRLPKAKLAGERSLSFLLHPTLGESELDLVASAVEKVMRVAAAG
ncbi:dTDP-4-amino-4,6-dideoxygalactose transaminase [Mariprofundus ferrinatatus]|uniref:dTDP-4-amino-4,6-dideoxygalactose transaminase n=1 Tax=Mariprofundus ferrinatatus TaxID=1921087 RepID=A0A2K8L2F0_9PROT|nr:DegT/DnrJ/EryC1/StrS aminotransferase family protein [Mariprofundus ferrinatatus]ATX81433.1 dTDP-4-amino-4,6-dideoxygalactose transaminase [Mariprofundus ferrinatatus]